MNIFLSQDTIADSVKDLDDLRLQKQLVECYQLLTLAIKEQQEGYEVKAGHYHHPVYLFYKDNIPFLCCYGLICCFEYSLRFNKKHKLFDYFYSQSSKFMKKLMSGSVRAYIAGYENPQFIPYYMEGSKGQPNYIRTTDNVSALFQQKLINKWNNDKTKGRPPRWTNRQVPEFYKKEMKSE